MSGWAVYIATTSGPSRVQRLSVDTQLDHSVMTINFRTQRSSVTNRYADFVSLDAGVIGRITGETRYRMRISEDIQRGDSWQLAAYISHLLFAEDKLNELKVPNSEDVQTELNTADGVIWASGIIGDDLSVHPVTGIRQKLNTSENLFREAAAMDLPIHCILPLHLSDSAGEEAELRQLISALLTRFPTLSFHRVARADDDSIIALLRKTNDESLTTGYATTPEQFDRNGRRRTHLIRVGLATACLLAVGAAFLQTSFGDRFTESLSTPDQADMDRSPNPTQPLIAEPPGAEPGMVQTAETSPPENGLPIEPQSEPDPIAIIEFDYSEDGDCFEASSSQRVTQTGIRNFLPGRIENVQLEQADMCRARLKLSDNQGQVGVAHNGLISSDQQTLSLGEAFNILVGGENDRDGLCAALDTRGATSVDICARARRGETLSESESAVLLDWHMTADTIE